MTTPNDQKQIQKVKTYVSQILESPATNVGDKLPRIRDIAQELHVAPAAVCKVIDKLTRTKKCTVIRGKGVYVGEVKKTHPPASAQKWQIIREALEKDILDGKFGRSGMLPSTSNLKNCYSSSYFILKKAK